MIIKYGNFDVTKQVYKYLVKDKYIYIPCSDFLRVHIFGNNKYGVHKDISIDNVIYNTDVFIDENNTIFTNNVPENIRDMFLYAPFFINYNEKLLNIHNELKIDYGYLQQEYPEQIMSVRYLTGKEKILEIGGNIGRNSIVIGYILNKNNNNNLVSLETNTEDAKKLEYNRDLNKLDFYVENAALSKRKLIQKGWNTIPVDECNEEDKNKYVEVKTITWEELNKKYNIVFDTLILDCEGAFYYILQDMPEILDNIKLILVENDYFNNERKKYVDSVLIKNGFYLDYTNCHTENIIHDNFYEAWIRD
jgi:FkbM family methyltransferase